jgi:hypothetical protein
MGTAKRAPAAGQLCHRASGGFLAQNSSASPQSEGKMASFLQETVMPTQNFIFRTELPELRIVRIFHAFLKESKNRSIDDPYTPKNSTLRMQNLGVQVSIWGYNLYAITYSWQHWQEMTSFVREGR